MTSSYNFSRILGGPESHSYQISQSLKHIDRTYISQSLKCIDRTYISPYYVS